MTSTATSPQWLVVSDLDGTLLNHHDYAWQAALPALESLQQADIPVVFNTSKTYRETRLLQQQMGVQAPFVVENGSAIFLPQSEFSQPEEASDERDGYWCITTGRSRESIADLWDELKLPENSCTRLSQCTVAEAQNLTGLSESQATDAIAREFSEPIIWRGSDDELNELKQALLRHGLNLLQGGRFLHILGDCDKGRAITRLQEQYSVAPKTIVLGDSGNDLAMLTMADVSIVVSSPGNHGLLPHCQPNHLTQQQAPEGWAEGIAQALRLIH